MKIELDEYICGEIVLRRSSHALETAYEYYGGNFGKNL